MPRETAAARAAGATQAALGVGFGVGALLTLRHLQAHDELPLTPFGFRAFSGPFERLGHGGFVTLLGSFAALCAVDILAGSLVWQRRRLGFTLGLATALPSFALSLGFALPFMLVGVPLRVVLAMVGRRSLH